MFALLAKIGIGSIINRLASAYEAREKAKGDAEIKKWDTVIARLEARASLQEEEARSGIKLNAFARLLIFGVPVGFILWKLLIWDKGVCPAVGWECRTDMSADLWSVVKWTAGFYLLAEGGVQAISRFKR